MSDAIGPPRRKHRSWESRCEIVAKVRLQGMNISRVAACSGVHRSTVYRLVAAYDAGGWSGLLERRPVPHASRVAATPTLRPASSTHAR